MTTNHVEQISVTTPPTFKQYPASAFRVGQTIYPDSPNIGPIAYSYYEAELTETILSDFLSTVKDGRIGLAPTYGRQQQLTSLAFSSKDEVLIVRFGLKPSNTPFFRDIRKQLQDAILTNKSYTKYAFYMDKICTGLFDGYGILINQAVDLLTRPKGGRYSMRAKVVLLGDKPHVDTKSVTNLFRRGESYEPTGIIIATQAWAAYRTTIINPMLGVGVDFFDTTTFTKAELRFLARSIREAELIRATKRTVKRSDNDEQHLEESLEMSTDPDFDSISEIARDRVLRSILNNSNIAFLRSTFLVRDLWIPRCKKHHRPTFKNPVTFNFDKYTLNPFQRTAVESILSNNDEARIKLIHGPAGSGKTLVIAASVVSIMASEDNSRTVWLVAQSNIAVQKIAEQLAAVDFYDFKIIIAKNFRSDCLPMREELHAKIEDKFIRTDALFNVTNTTEELLGGCRVILCTLNMLSHNAISMVAHLVPPTLVIFDEANQIEIGGYIPVLDRFGESITKLVFVGDPKQLPPYMQTMNEDLQSVFDMGYLKTHTIFLDTQYRMPHAIGNVLSELVYDSQLNTHHDIEGNSCIRFIDVANGQEKPAGNGTVNEEEAHFVVSLSKKMEELGQRFRVITPYDAQRALIESGLRSAELNLQNKVFSVDSFQGQEEDYVIISLVRTENVGVLGDMRRCIVMLSRCTKGVVICTNKTFLDNVASNSLISRVAQALGDEVWIDSMRAAQPDLYLL